MFSFSIGRTTAELRPFPKSSETGLGQTTESIALLSFNFRIPLQYGKLGIDANKLVAEVLEWVIPLGMLKAALP